MFKIAKNTWIDGFRKKRVQPFPLEEEYFEPVQTNALDIREAFELMAERLSVRQAVLLLMLEVFGFTAKETADHLGSTEGAVKEALKRTRLRLHRLASQSDYVKEKKPKPIAGERMTQELMELFIQAFRSGNIHKIYTAYTSLRHSGLDVTMVRSPNEFVYFDFQDPNGHVLRIQSKIC